MKRLLGAAVAAGLVLLTGSPALADGETESESLAQTSGYVGPSLVYIESSFEAYVFDPLNNQYLNNGEPFPFAGRCTGYVVNPDGYIATAGHCVDNLGRGGSLQESLLYAGAQWAYETNYYGAGTYGSPEAILAAETYELEGAADGDLDPDLVSVQVSWPADASGGEIGESVVAEVVEWHPITGDDSALLKVNLDGLYPLPLSDGENVDVGTPLVAIGYPGSVDEVTTPTLNGSYKEGTVSSVKTNQAATGDVYEHSAAVSGGMSGGPVVNLDHEVIGFNSFGPSGETQAFNFSGPAEAILTLMQQNGVENELGTLGQQYRDGLDALYAGDRDAAITAFEAVLDEDSDNPYAQMYLEEAEDLAANTDSAESDSGSGFPVLWVAIGAGALVLIGLVLFLLLRKKPGSSSSSPSTGPAVPGVAAWPPPGQAQQPYQQPQPYHQPQPAQRAYPPAPAPTAPHSPAPTFDPNKTTYVGQPETPYIPQQQGQPPHPGQQPPR